MSIMAARDTIVFHAHLIQDVSVLRPLLRLARRTSQRDIVMLLAEEFLGYDSTGAWRAEIGHICSELDIALSTYATPFDALTLLAGRRGLIVAGSESDNRAHAATHQLFRALPPEFLRVTLQHGFECLGFLHNAAHDAATGHAVRFAADILVGWLPAERLTALMPAERPKLYTAGPMHLLEQPAAPERPAFHPLSGVVCENLHSVRFKHDSTRKTFIEDLSAFAALTRQLDGTLHLRPHPAGNYTLRKNVPLPEGVRLNQTPLYRLHLPDFDFCISTPSSVLFDFVLAGVPVAVWADAEGWIDTRNYTGLETVVTAEDWWRFALRCASDPKPLLHRQARFLAELGLPADTEDRYARLLSLG